MGNKLGKKSAPEKKFKRYLENDKGDLVDVLGLYTFLRSPQERMLVYPIVEVRLQCRYPAMQRQMLRYRSFSCMVDSSMPALGVWPSRMAEDGYFFQMEQGRVVCFYCNQEYRHHLPGCRRVQMNIQSGVQAPVSPVTLQQLSSVNPVRGLQIRGVRGVEDSNDGDLSLDVLLQRSRPPSDDDHDVHPAGRTNAAVPVPSQPSHRGSANSVPQSADLHPRSASRRHEERDSRDLAGTPCSPLAESAPIMPVSDHPLRRGRATATTPVIEDSHPLCKICNVQPVRITFLPCGHTVCCVYCGSQQQRCPLCRQMVQSGEVINGRL